MNDLHEEVSQEIYNAMIWACNEPAPPNGAAYPDWTYKGNSFAQDRARQVAAVVITRILRRRAELQARHK